MTSEDSMTPEDIDVVIADLRRVMTCIAGSIQLMQRAKHRKMLQRRLQ